MTNHNITPYSKLIPILNQINQQKFIITFGFQDKIAQLFSSFPSLADSSASSYGDPIVDCTFGLHAFCVLVGDSKMTQQWVFIMLVGLDGNGKAERMRV